MDNIKSVFYLGTDTALGYSPIFSEVYSPFSNNRTYIIKGAGRNHRHTLITEIANVLIKEGFECETILSCIDNETVEGAIFKEIGVCILDGNYPNHLEPIMCDCTEYTVDLGELCDRRKLYSARNEISQLRLKADEQNRKCVKFLNAASTMKEDITRVIGDCLSADKLEKYIDRFTSKELGNVSETSGKEHKRYLSAVTPNGIKTQFDTVRNGYSKIYVLEDKTGCVSKPFISQMKNAAILCGYDIVSCINPIDGKSDEHLLIPKLSIAIITSNDLHKWKYECTKKISSSRFTDREIIRSHKGRVKFNLDAINDLTEQACIHLSEAEKYIRKTDDIYDKYSDISKLSDIAFEIEKDILSLVQAE